MSKWIWIRYARSVGHLVEERFVSAVKADLESRDCGELEKEEVVVDPRFYLDAGGVLITSEPSEELGDIDGLEIGGRSANVPLFVERARKLQERDGGYVKLHSFHSCLVMSPEQRDRLVAELERVQDSAVDRSDRHFEEWKARNREQRQ